MALTDLATRILDFTRIVTNADGVLLGKPFLVDVVPGASPSLPAVGALAGTLDALPHDLGVTVTASIRRNGQSWVAPTVQPTPLSFAFLLVPAVGAEGLPSEPTHYEITLNITVTLTRSSLYTGTAPPIESATISRSFVIPIDVPTLEIPAVLLLGRHGDFKLRQNKHAGWLFVMVRGGSVLKSAGDVVNVLNTLGQTIRNLQSVLGWGQAIGAFTGALSKAVDLINEAPTIFFEVAGVRHMGDFDDEASASLLIGTAGTKVSFFSQADFNEQGWQLEYEKSVFEVGDIGAAGFLTGVGVNEQVDLSLVSWDTDPGDDMNDDIESCHFEPPSQPKVSPPPSLTPRQVVKRRQGQSSRVSRRPTRVKSRR